MTESKPVLFTRVQALIEDGQKNTASSLRPWFVYLLECSGGRIYTGIAVDVARRVALHQSGKGARFTRMHVPQALLGSFAFPDRGSASRAENAIKRLDAAAKRVLLAAITTPECAAPGPDRSCPDP